MYVDQCDMCHQSNPLTANRDKIIIYIEDPSFSWMRLECPCGFRTRIYLNNPTRIVEIADFLHNIVLIDFVPDDVREGLAIAKKRGLTMEEEAAILSLEAEYNA